MLKRLVVQLGKDSHGEQVQAWGQVIGKSLIDCCLLSLLCVNVCYVTDDQMLCYTKTAKKPTGETFARREKVSSFLQHSVSVRVLELKLLLHTRLVRQVQVRRMHNP